jgi:chromosome segregation ATPase
VEADNIDELREELARLEAEEARVSAQRRHLHHQIDFGYASDEARAREREISDQRHELHRRIDELRVRLGLRPGPPETQSESLELSSDPGGSGGLLWSRELP